MKHPKFPLEQRLTRAQAAEYLGKKRATLDDWAAKGTGPDFYSAGREVFYMAGDLDKWIMQNSPRAARPKAADPAPLKTLVKKKKPRPAS